MSISPFDIISVDCIIKIFTKIEPKSYFRCREVCQQFYQLINQELKLSSDKFLLMTILKGNKDSDSALLTQVVQICSLIPKILCIDEEERGNFFQSAVDLCEQIRAPELKFKASCSLIPIIHFQKATKLLEESIAYCNSLEKKEKEIGMLLRAASTLISKLETTQAQAILTRLLTFTSSIPGDKDARKEIFNVTFKIAEKLASIDSEAAINLLGLVESADTIPKELQENVAIALLNASELNLIPFLELLCRPKNKLIMYDGISLAIFYGVHRLAEKDKAASIDLLKRALGYVDQFLDFDRKIISLTLFKQFLTHLEAVAKIELAIYQTLINAQTGVDFYFHFIEQYLLFGHLIEYIDQRDSLFVEILGVTNRISASAFLMDPPMAHRFLDTTYDLLLLYGKDSLSGTSFKETYSDLFKEFFTLALKITLHHPEVSKNIFTKSWQIAGLTQRNLFSNLPEISAEVLTACLRSNRPSAIEWSLRSLMRAASPDPRGPIIINLITVINKTDIDISEFTSLPDYDKFSELLSLLVSHYTKKRNDPLSTLLEKGILKILDHGGDQNQLNLLLSYLVKLSLNSADRAFPLLMRGLNRNTLESTLLFLMDTQYCPVNSSKEPYQAILDMILSAEDTVHKLDLLEKFVKTKLFLNMSTLYEIDHLKNIYNNLEGQDKIKFSGIAETLLAAVEVPLDVAVSLFNMCDYKKRESFEKILNKYKQIIFFAMIQFIERYCNSIKDPLEQTLTFKKFFEIEEVEED